ncbi:MULTISPECIES: hypothetical protein [Paenibacillus]|uniref:hypothetical protein n=1 Tax=Paenibacillus TaxID=44249 RepID=UPI0022830CCE|nr:MULTISPECIES: hypothetical protein [Paenibacillus]MCY9744718.1 hypothetical protein [Paenibacillus larvae]MCY9748918.1 hypothetical protein [Paenibacillus larvae]MCY9771474.1 hypothetical protein [Paenibacillus alvei]MDR5608984.1 hypothetical protein [Paenibacillus larvae]
MKKSKKCLLSIAVVTTILGSGIALNLPQTSEDSAVAAIHGTGNAPAVFASAIHGTGEHTTRSS